MIHVSIGGFVRLFAYTHYLEVKYNTGAQATLDPSEIPPSGRAYIRRGAAYFVYLNLTEGGSIRPSISIADF